MAFLLVTGVTLGVRAQDVKKMEISSNDVPQAVKTSFNCLFANTSDIEWKKKDNDYKVSFKMNNTEHHGKQNSKIVNLRKGY